MAHKEELLELLDKDRGTTKESAGELFRSQEWCNARGRLPLMLGRDEERKIATLDLAKAPNLLIAGVTGAGKTTFIELCLLSLMLKNTPDELKLILVDYRAVEYAKYEDSPYLQFPVITNTKDALRSFQWLNREMERRFELFKNAGCRDIREWNTQMPDALPYIVAVIDELAFIMFEAKSQTETLLSRLCARARAAGMHFIFSTQRPDNYVLPQCIEASFPTRIAFRMVSYVDSMNFLHSEKWSLLPGEMLYRAADGELREIYGGCDYVKETERKRILEHLQAKYADRKPSDLPSLQSMELKPFGSFRNKFVDIFHDILEKKLDYLKDDIIIDVAGELADSVIDHFDEFQTILKDTNESDEESQHRKIDSELLDSEMFREAVRIVIEEKQTKISYLQRKLRIGYNKVSSIVDALEQYGIVSPVNNEKRTILVDSVEVALKRLSKPN